VVEDAATGKLKGVEAVIDKDRAATLVGVELEADGLLVLTDVTAVATDFKQPNEKWIRAVSPGMLESMMEQFPDGSMGPKVASAIDFVRKTGGRGWAAIGSLKEAEGILAKTAGTRIEIRPDGKDFIEYYEDAPVSFPKAA